MWKCPNCGREFKNTNQDHFCGEPPKTIDDYIALESEDVQQILNKVRNTLRDVLPDAIEKISWRMPTYWKNHNIIHFASFKNHLGIYPGPLAIEHFADKLKNYKTSKGAIQFQYSEPIPYELIAEIAKWCYATGNHH
ncbi:MAG: DUF1801 domain-containing protein [Eubacteriales bacterium]